MVPNEEAPVQLVDTATVLWVDKYAPQVDVRLRTFHTFVDGLPLTIFASDRSGCSQEQSYSGAKLAPASLAVTGMPCCPM
jgi:hypothetical protein